MYIYIGLYLYDILNFILGKNISLFEHEDDEQLKYNESDKFISRELFFNVLINPNFFKLDRQEIKLNLNFFLLNSNNIKLKPRFFYRNKNYNNIAHEKNTFNSFLKMTKNHL